MKCLNLGCGLRFHDDWVNVDFQKTGVNVIAHNLNEGIPFDDCTFDVVYHSHLLEHFTKASAEKFLLECYRVLRPEGIIRVAVPDLEKICRLYLESLDKAESGDQDWQHNYEWMMLELFDQTVRNQSGGEMLQYLLQASISNEKFIASRLGTFYQTLKGWIAPLKNKTDRGDIHDNKVITEAEIGKFRNSGEIHQWMYDRYSLKKLLIKTGFSKICLQTASQSYIVDWLDFCLDTDRDGTVYKADSLYMEGLK